MNAALCNVLGTHVQLIVYLSVYFLTINTDYRTPCSFPNRF